MELSAQGATEYLVLLAVVLIVALVSVALLGFFPGMASDAQVTQSKAYWASMQPISIIEMDAKWYGLVDSPYTKPYLRIRNSGPYPIRITKLLAGRNSTTVVSLDVGYGNLSDYYYLASGEEKYFADTGFYTVSAARNIIFSTGSSSSNHILAGAAPGCTAPASGAVVVNNFGFEYIAYVDGQEITKSEIGAKPLVIKCS